MKKFMCSLSVIVMLTIVSLTSFAQIENIKLSDDITINSVYIGALGGTKFSTDSLYANGFTSFRIGAIGTYQPVKWFSINTYGMAHMEPDTIFSLQGFSVKLVPFKKFSIEMGSTATIPTEQRPHPVGGGHFETGGEGTIPGGAINIKAKYEFNSDFKIGTGVALRNDKPEYSGMVYYKSLKLSGWYSEYNQKFGTALTVDIDSLLYSVLVYKDDQTIANFSQYKFGESRTLAIYSDVIYDFNKKELTRGEWGLLKLFESTKFWIGGLYGLGYDLKTNTINGYIFIYPKYKFKL